MSTYDQIGKAYGSNRRDDPHIAQMILRSLDGCRSVVNVGAGTGSYEVRDRFVVAAELSAVMIEQRPRDAAPAVQATALELPFNDKSFDASLAILTIHHWTDWERGTRELARVASKRTVILTWVPIEEEFWLCRYFPELRAVDLKSFPTIEGLERILGPLRVTVVPVPHDCRDGFMGAYWRRPQAYLDENVRRGISSFHRLDNVEAGIAQLRKALSNGEWFRDFGHLLTLNELDLGYRIIVCDHAASLDLAAGVNP